MSSQDNEKPNWSEIIKAFKKSNLTQKKFCEQNQLKHSTFKNRLHRGQKDNEHRATTHPALHPINLISTKSNSCKIQCPNGIEINISQSSSCRKIMTCLLEVLNDSIA